MEQSFNFGSDLGPIRQYGNLGYYRELLRDCDKYDPVFWGWQFLRRNKEFRCAYDKASKALLALKRGNSIYELDRGQRTELDRYMHFLKFLKFEKIPEPFEEAPLITSDRNAYFLCDDGKNKSDENLETIKPRDDREVTVRFSLYDTQNQREEYLRDVIARCEEKRKVNFMPAEYPKLLFCLDCIDAGLPIKDKTEQMDVFSALKGLIGNFDRTTPQKMCRTAESWRSLNYRYLLGNMGV